MSLYKLVTTENVDLNYKAFKKDELIDCILNLRTTYFRLKKENEENKQLKDELKSKPDVQITLQDDKGNKFMVIQTERIDMQVELNKTIEKLFNNWNKLKEYIRKNIIYDDVGMKILDSSPLEDYIQELEGSDSNE